MTYDCQRCGACCCNTDENRVEGYPWYVPIDDPASPLLADRALRGRFTVDDPVEGPHLRLEPDGRCSALKGRLGAQVACQVYRFRPTACRRVQPGDAGCLAAREERGIVD
jgi:Fe-S-cluster containining protein